VIRGPEPTRERDLAQRSVRDTSRRAVFVLAALSVVGLGACQSTSGKLEAGVIDALKRNESGLKLCGVASGDLTDVTVGNLQYSGAGNGGTGSADVSGTMPPGHGADKCSAAVTFSYVETALHGKQKRNAFASAPINVWSISARQ
jgi:hypothetical protein